MQKVTLPHTEVYMVANGSPGNVVMLSGSPEPCLIHLVVEMLC